jgi:uncharacterized damage-inducible protein DinB
MKLQHLMSHWQGIRADLLETIDKFNDQELSFVPYGGAWSVGQILRPIAHEEEIEIHYGLTRQTTEFPPEYGAQDYATVEAIKALLAEVHGRTQAYLEGLGDADLDRQVEAAWGQTYRQYASR